MGQPAWQGLTAAGWGTAPCSLAAAQLTAAGWRAHARPAAAWRGTPQMSACVAHLLRPLMQNVRAEGQNLPCGRLAGDFEDVRLRLHVCLDY